jgi:hypothetical protein
VTSFSPAQDTAAQAPAATWFAAIEILYPTFALRLLDGSGFLTLFGNTFVGGDPTYGALQGIESFSDGTADTSPVLKVTLLPPTNTAMAALGSSAAQGSQVSLWVGIVNPVTGLPVSDPDLRFIGSMDVPTIQVAQNEKTLELVCVSAFEQFFRDDEGVRLCDSWHQSVWPGELGLQFVSAVQVSMPWGSDAPRPSLVTDISATQSSLSNTAVGSPLGGGAGGILNRNPSIR